MSFGELTRAYFGEVLSVDDVFARLELSPFRVATGVDADTRLWLGSVGYERHSDVRDFAQRLRDIGVERLIDVRELPISRRRGYGKTALAAALSSAGIEYLHVKALGNPKPYRTLYKSGRVSEGRRRYEHYLLTEQREALQDLAGLLLDKRSVLMCVEHDGATCHRAVIIDALRDELGLDLNVAQIA